MIFTNWGLSLESLCNNLLLVGRVGPDSVDPKKFVSDILDIEGIVTAGEKYSEPRIVGLSAHSEVVQALQTLLKTYVEKSENPEKSLERLFVTPDVKNNPRLKEVLNAYVGELILRTAGEQQEHFGFGALKLDSLVGSYLANADITETALETALETLFGLGGITQSPEMRDKILKSILRVYNNNEVDQVKVCKLVNTYYITAGYTASKGDANFELESLALLQEFDSQDLGSALKQALEVAVQKRTVIPNHHIASQIPNSPVPPGANQDTLNPSKSNVNNLVDNLSDSLQIGYRYKGKILEKIQLFLGDNEVPTEGDSDVSGTIDIPTHQSIKLLLENVFALESSDMRFSLLPDQHKQIVKNVLYELIIGHIKKAKDMSDFEKITLEVFISLYIDKSKNKAEALRYLFSNSELKKEETAMTSLGRAVGKVPGIQDVILRLRNTNLDSSSSVDSDDAQGTQEDAQPLEESSELGIISLDLSPHSWLKYIPVTTE